MMSYYFYTIHNNVLLTECFLLAVVARRPVNRHQWVMAFSVRFNWVFSLHISKLSKKVMDTCFIDVKTKADIFIRKCCLISLL